MSATSANTSQNSQWCNPNYSAGFSGEEDIDLAWRRGLTPDPTLTVDQWADEYRYLSSRGSAEKGKYRTDRAPFNRKIMAALSASSKYRRIVFMKATQVGASEDGNNWIGYCIHQMPAPFLAVQPTTDLAKRFSKQRIDSLIEETPVLADLVKPSRSRDSGNTRTQKDFPGGVLVITGANSAVGLRSMPARYIFFDEVDAYPDDINEEGDPIKLAERRATTFGHRAKLFIVSTPTIKGISRIEAEYEKTDQQRYFVPCPHCGTMQWLKFEHLRWTKDAPETAHYVCETCEKEIHEHHKTAMLEHGEWRPTAKCNDPTIIGFHISSLYSPVGWMSWAEIAREWDDAQGNESKIKTFKNTLLGETFQEKGEAPDWKLLYDRKREHRIGDVPEEAIILTAGVDVQRGRLEVDIWGWGLGSESWLIDHLVIEGDSAKKETWLKLNEYLPKLYLRADGKELPVLRWAVDTGDGYSTTQAYDWCRRHPGVAIAIKGRAGFNAVARVEGPRWVEVTERGRKIKNGVKLYLVYVDVFKSETYRFLRLERPTDEDMENGEEFPDAYIHIPDGTSEEWFKQLCSEQLVTIKSKRKRSFLKQEWQKLRERNEALDCRVYARAAAWLMGVDRWPMKKDSPKSVKKPPKKKISEASDKANHDVVDENPASEPIVDATPVERSMTREEILAGIRNRIGGYATRRK